MDESLQNLKSGVPREEKGKLVLRMSTILIGFICAIMILPDDVFGLFPIYKSVTPSGISYIWLNYSFGVIQLLILMVGLLYSLKLNKKWLLGLLIVMIARELYYLVASENSIFRASAYEMYLTVFVGYAFVLWIEGSMPALEDRECMFKWFLVTNMLTLYINYAMGGTGGVVKAYAKQFGVDKLKWVVSGGNSGQESIRNGVYALEGICSDEDIVIIHDGIRPLVDETVLTDVIVKCQQYGNAVTSLPYNEQIFVVDDDISTVKYIPRETLRRVSTPQAYKFGKLDWAYHEAFEKEIGIYGSSYTNTMMVELGERLYFAAGSDKNIKLTTKDDLEMFKAYLKSDKDNWLK